MLFLHSWSNPILDAVSWLFCISRQGNETGRAKSGSSCTLTYRVSCQSMQQCHVHYPVHRIWYFNADSITRGQGKTFMPWFLHITVFKVRKAMGHVFLILSFCCSHFCVFYWDSLKENSGWLMYVNVICYWDAGFILPLISWSFSLYFLPQGFTCCFHTLQFRSSSGIKKNLSSTSWSRILVMSSSQQLLLFLVAFIVITRFIHVF